MQIRLSMGPTARIFECLPLHMLCSRGETLFEEGVFTSFPRSTYPASAEVERWLFSWESQMDQMEGMKTASPYLLPFPSDPAPYIQMTDMYEHTNLSFVCSYISNMYEHTNLSFVCSYMLDMYENTSDRFVCSYISNMYSNVAAKSMCSVKRVNG